MKRTKAEKKKRKRRAHHDHKGVSFQSSEADNIPLAEILTMLIAKSRKRYVHQTEFSK